MLGINDNFGISRNSEKVIKNPTITGDNAKIKYRKLLYLVFGEKSHCNIFFFVGKIFYILNILIKN